MADIENKAEHAILALNTCRERLKIVTIDKPIDYASCQKDLSVTCIILANEADLDQKKKLHCKTAIDACNEALKIYTLSDFPVQYAEVQTLLWAGFSALAEVEEKSKNCLLAIKACQEALQVYAKRSSRDYIDTLKNLGYTYVTLAEVENRAENCRKAIDAYNSAVEVCIAGHDELCLEHAEMQMEMGYVYVMLSNEENKIQNCKMALRAYKKAFRSYLDAAKALEAEDDPKATEAKGNADKCQTAMDACRRILKNSRKKRKVIGPPAEEDSQVKQDGLNKCQN